MERVRIETFDNGKAVVTYYDGVEIERNIDIGDGGREYTSIINMQSGNTYPGLPFPIITSNDFINYSKLYIKETSEPYEELKIEETPLILHQTGQIIGQRQASTTTNADLSTKIITNDKISDNGKFYAVETINTKFGDDYSIDSSIRVNDFEKSENYGYSYKRNIDGSEILHTPDVKIEKKVNGEIEETNKKTRENYFYDKNGYEILNEGTIPKLENPENYIFNKYKTIYDTVLPAYHLMNTHNNLIPEEVNVAKEQGRGR